MIILSAGMPRAGSGWYYNLTHELALAAGYQDARQIRQKFHLQGVLTEVNCNIGALTLPRLLAVLAPALLGNTFVIKTHAAPGPFALALIRRGLIRPAYIYRDPRDALLSAMENGRRALQKGRSNAFSHLTGFETALDFMQDYLRIWEAWMRCDRALHTRYEDLLSEYDSQVGRLLSFLKMDRDSQVVCAVVEKFRPEQAQPGQKGLHFSQGKTGRFRQKMTAEQQEIMAEKFAPYLERMGYKI